VSDRSSIEWTDATWNVATGCTKVSPGCAHCYIEHTPPFRINGRRFVRGHIPLQLHPDRFEQPAHWRRPRRIFVNSLSDLFHEELPDSFLDNVYDAMEQAQQHQFHVLTKRPQRMRSYLERRYANRIPSRHIWHGVTVENRRWHSRIDELRDSRTALRYLSLEPLLEDLGELDLHGIHGLIVGGESGSDARPCEAGWIRSLVRQGRANGVPVFVKQLGSKPFHARAMGLPIILHPRDRKGADPAEWPDDLRVREFPPVTADT